MAEVTQIREFVVGALETVDVGPSLPAAPVLALVGPDESPTDRAASATVEVTGAGPPPKGGEGQRGPDAAR